MFGTLLQVALGGAIGASGRYLAGVAAVRVFGHGFPVGTLAVNIIGSFAMGCLVTWFALVGGTRAAPFLITGILGGFTTFSAFSLDAVTLFERGQAGLALIYVLGSVGLSVGGLVVGASLTRLALA